MTDMPISRLAGILLLLTIGGAAVSANAQPAADGIAPYRAVYTVLNDGKRVGEAVHTLSYDASSRHYVFETRIELRGLLRLLSSQPAIERSEFIIRDGRIRPLTFIYEDGRRSEEDDVAIEFDWARQRLVSRGEASSQTWPLPENGLDRASARVALMRDLAAAMDSATYQIADPYEFRPLELRRDGVESLTTVLGELRTVRVVYQRPGSSRSTLSWAAPNLHFLAVRIEQHRDDRGPVAFVLDAVEWVNAAPPTAR